MLNVDLKSFKKKHKKKINQIDGALIDLGHPWKTNEYDLYETLKYNNFEVSSNIVIYFFIIFFSISCKQSMAIATSNFFCSAILRAFVLLLSQIKSQ